MTRIEIARARWQLWAVTFAIIASLAGAIIVLAAAADPGDQGRFLPPRAMLAVGLGGMIAAFVLYAIDRERNLHRLTVRLIQERIEAEQLADRLVTLSELARERDTNAALLEGSADAIAVVDVEGHIVRFNPAMEELTGVKASDAVGRSAFEVLKFGTGEDAGDPLLASLADGLSRAGLELRLLDAEGAECWVSATFSPITEFDEGLVLLLVSLRDIREQKEQERQQRDFVSVAAHELRSPLTAIKGFARTLKLKGEQLPRERRDAYLDMVNEQSNRLARLVDDLMQVARIDAGRVVLETTEVDLEPLLLELVEQFREKWRDRSVHVRVDQGVPAVLADPHRVEEVLINLIDNAIKYSPSGAPVEVAIAERAGIVEVTVRDRGIGIPAEKIPTLFEKFHRLRDPSVVDVPGTGLGLYIVKGLVEAHGGRVGVHSAPGDGSAFSFTLPRALVPVGAATGTDQA
jgi:two-component system phosphate regulon sensor histidine kinase PhoR